MGLCLFGAHVLARRWLSAQWVRLTTRLLALVLLPIHLVCLLFTMVRWDSGFRSINPFNGSWAPPLGVALPILTCTVAVGVLFAVYWLASRIPAEETEPERPAEPEPALAGV